MECELYRFNGSHYQPICFIDEPNAADNVYFWVYGVGMTAIILLGLFGNFVSIIVFLSPRLWSCLSFYLVALAGWDSVLLLSAFTNWSLWALWHQKSIPLMGDHVSLMRFAYFCGNMTLTGCAWVTVCLTAERYLAIVHPLRHRTHNNEFRAKILILMVSLASFALNIPRLFEAQIIYDDLFHRPNNQSEFKAMPQLVKSPVYKDHIYFIFYRVIMSSLLTYLLPTAAIFAMTTRMCLVLRKAKANRRTINAYNQTTNSQNDIKLRKKTQPNSDTQNTNVTLVIVLLKGLFCYLLPTVIDIIELIFTEIQFHVELLITFSNLLVVLNSSLNFYIYLFQCRRFKRELRRLSLTKHASLTDALNKDFLRLNSRYSSSTPRPTIVSSTNSSQIGVFGVFSSAASSLFDVSVQLCAGNLSLLDSENYLTIVRRDSLMPPIIKHHRRASHPPMINVSERKVKGKLPVLV